MKIKPFLVEEWMNAYENDASFNIAETCVDSVSLDELFELTGEDRDAFWNTLSARRLTYGDIWGRPEFLEGISRLYRTLEPQEIIPTHGAAGANHHVFYSLIEAGDKVVSIMPTYQQLYSIPESYGADLSLMQLKPENAYLPDLEELRRLCAGGVKMICLNNPNNPTGALMSREMLSEIVEIAREHDAWLFCDEVYRHLTQEDIWCDSVADLYEKGISVSSMSKVFSLAGIRLGWVATHDEAARTALLSHRDYNLISCGIFDEAVAALALKHSDVLLERNRAFVRRNLALVDEWVKNEPLVRYIKPRAGTTALIYYDAPISSYDLGLKLLRQEGTLITPGDCFEEAGSIRLGYACETEELKSGLAAISRILHEGE